MDYNNVNYSISFKKFWSYIKMNTFMFRKVQTLIDVDGKRNLSLDIQDFHSIQ